MTKINSIEEMEVFKKSHNLTVKIYKITEAFPQSEKFGLTFLAKDLGYLPESEYGILRDELEEISKMLNGLIRSLSYSDTDTKH